MLGLSPSDNDAAINAYKTQYGITNPCAGTEGGGPEAIDLVIAGQSFLGYPTYCIVCPDKTLYFDVCWPPTASCFDPIIASCAPPLVAQFSADPTTGCVGQEVAYIDESTGNPTSWTWTFEGGNPPKSTDEDPIVIYDTPGDYDVTLEISDGTNTVSNTEPDFMPVFEVPVVTLDPLDTTCHNYAPFPLSGGDPPGGYYEGPGVNMNIFDPAAAGLGTHTITYYYSENNCEGFAVQPIVVDICAGIGQNADNKFGIYPNPSSGDFTLQIDHTGKVTIVVYDLMGKIIYDNEIMANGKEKLRIDLNGNVNGLYLVSITTDNRTYVEKIRIVK